MRLTKRNPLSGDWVAQWSILYARTKRCLWAQFALPPTSSGVNHALNQRPVFLYKVQFHLIRLIVVVHSTSDPLSGRSNVECSFNVVLSTCFPYSLRKNGKPTLVGIEPPTYYWYVRFIQDRSAGFDSHQSRFAVFSGRKGNIWSTSRKWSWNVPLQTNARRKERRNI